MTTLILSCSLKPMSNSRILAKELNTEIEGSILVDLRDYPLPFCNADDCYNDPNVTKLKTFIEDASRIIIAAPVYNYGLNSAIKNVIELTGKSWCDKIVGFACAAGGKASYMSPLSVANSLMLDFRCLIVPRFVYATGENFKDHKLEDGDVKERLTLLAQEIVKIKK